MSQGAPKGLSFSICKMGKLELVTHSLGFFWPTGGEVGIHGEILKVHKVVNELVSVQPATPQGAAALSYFCLPKSGGRDPDTPGSWLSWGLALDSVSSSGSLLPSMPVFAFPGPGWSGAIHAYLVLGAEPS